MRFGSLLHRDHRPRALRPTRARFLDLRGGRELTSLKRQQRSLGKHFELQLFDLDAVGVAFVELDGDQAFQRAFVGVVVDEFGGGLAVDEVLEAVPLRDDDVFVPLAHIDLHGRVLAELPEGAIGVEEDVFAVQAEDAATAFLIRHAGVLDGGMDVALVASDDPRGHVLQLATAILDAAVVIPDDADGGTKLEVLHRAAAPDEEAVVRHGLRRGIRADDDAILDLPKLRIAVPAGEIFAVEERREAIVRGEDGGSEE